MAKRITVSDFYKAVVRKAVKDEQERQRKEEQMLDLGVAILFEQDLLKEKLEEDDYIRASKDCICPECGEKYIKHPLFEFVNVLCDGTLVKL